MAEKAKPTQALKVGKVKEVIEAAKQTLADLTGFKTPRGIGAQKTDKGWMVRVEITEKSSIPESMDVLGIYDVLMSEQDEIISYERKGMKKRGDVEAIIEE